MSKSNDTTKINTVAKTALGSRTVLDDAKLDAVAGGGKIKFNEFTIKKTTDSP